MPNLAMLVAVHRVVARGQLLHAMKPPCRGPRVLWHRAGTRLLRTEPAADLHLTMVAGHTAGQLRVTAADHIVVQRLLTNVPHHPTVAVLMDAPRPLTVAEALMDEPALRLTVVAARPRPTVAEAMVEAEAEPLEAVVAEVALQLRATAPVLAGAIRATAAMADTTKL